MVNSYDNPGSDRPPDINGEANSECLPSASSWEYKETEKGIIASVSGNIVTFMNSAGDYEDVVDEMNYSVIPRHISSGIIVPFFHNVMAGYAQSSLITRGSPCNKTYTLEDLYARIRNIVIFVAGCMVASVDGKNIKTENVKPSKLPDPLYPFMTSIKHIIAGG